MTPLETFGLVVSFVAAVAALITAIVKGKSAQTTDRKAQAETEKTGINGQAVIIASLATEVKRLTIRVEVVEAEKQAMGTRVTQLETDYTLLRRQYTHVFNWARPKGYEPPPHW